MEWEKPRQTLSPKKKHKQMSFCEKTKQSRIRKKSRQEVKIKTASQGGEIDASHNGLVDGFNLALTLWYLAVFLQNADGRTFGRMHREST